MTHVSVILTTRNRVASLRETLGSLAQLHVPAGLHAELIVVDNGSTDGTPELLKGFRTADLGVRLVAEPLAGQCRAYNRAVSVARGEVLLFTDDDVVVPADWIERLCRPIFAGKADAATGPVRVAPHLVRPWLGTGHLGLLACNYGADPSRVFLVGANMAVSARALAKVPRFDDETGPGAIGHASDTLFSVQLEEAGFNIRWVSDAVVEHHFSSHRLSRRSFLELMRRRGEFNAYVAHHWYHAEWRLPTAKMLREWGRIQANRALHFKEWWHHPAAPEWELRLLEGYWTFRNYSRERRVARKYARRGLVKLCHARPA